MDTEIQEIIEEKAIEIKEQLAQFSLDCGLFEQGVQLQFTLTAKLIDPVSSVVQVAGEELMLKEVITRKKLLEAGLNKTLAGAIIQCLKNGWLNSFGYRSGGADDLSKLDWETATFDQFRVLYGRLEDPEYLRGTQFGKGSASGLLTFMKYFGYY